MSYTFSFYKLLRCFLASFFLFLKLKKSKICSIIYLVIIMSRIIFHIDVNNAFLSWTAVKLLSEGYPIDIREIPSVIGGDESSRHGIVLAKSPVAKKFGVVTAETLYMARKKCPNLKVFPSDMKYYKEMSKKMIDYISNYSPDLEQFSVDECFLDLTGTSYLYDDIISLAYKIKDEIYSKFGFTVNIGIGNNKLCAKMASDFLKPNKVHTLFDSEIKDKLWPLQIDDLFMVGKKSAAKLHSMGLHTIGDVANCDINKLVKEFKSFGNVLYERANGIDDSVVDSNISESKSISVSWTIDHDTDDVYELKKILLKQVDEVGRSLRRKKLYTSVIAVTFKTYDFISFSKQATLDFPINSNEDIYDNVIKILYKAWNFEKIRNIGIRLSGFSETRLAQSNLFDEAENKVDNNEKIQSVLDKIKDKYGTDIINPASLLNDDKKS